MLKLFYFSIVVASFSGAMSDWRVTTTALGFTSSIGSYYYLMKAIDPNTDFPERTHEYETRKISNYKHAAGLQLASLALLSPQLAHSDHWPVRLCIIQMGSLYIAIGVYNLDEAFKNYKKYQRTREDLPCEQAFRDCFMGVMFLMLGGATCPCAFAR